MELCVDVTVKVSYECVLGVVDVNECVSTLVVGNPRFIWHFSEPCDLPGELVSKFLEKCDHFLVGYHGRSGPERDWLYYGVKVAHFLFEALVF